MIKFKSRDIVIGEIKQVLASFNLPRYRVYTDEQVNYVRQNEQDKLNTETKIASQLDYINVLKNDRDFAIQNIEDSTLPAAEKAARIQTYEKLYNGYTEAGVYHQGRIAKAEEAKIAADVELAEIMARPAELNVISTIYRNTTVSYPGTRPRSYEETYPEKMRYMPYIKDGIIQEYANDKWIACHEEFSGHSKTHKDNEGSKVKRFHYNKRELNYTTRLKIKNNYYDNETHEYLGNYLRFQRDYNNINLMPLYNCFGKQTCSNMSLKLTFTEPDSESVTGESKVLYTTSFDTKDKRFKIYMLPVKLFQKYTIAIECGSDVEICCGLYGQYFDSNEKFDGIYQATYQCFQNMSFSQPQLYTKVLELTDFLSETSVSELAQNEGNLKMFIKLPIGNESSITVLEGDYLNYNDSIFRPIENTETANTGNAIASLGRWERLTNHAIFNFEYDEVYYEDSIKKYTPLQLLMANTKDSYPFADKLIGYLVGHTITPFDEISDNILRVNTVVGNKVGADVPKNPIQFSIDGLWKDQIPAIVYSYMNRHQNTFTDNHDILGYIDSAIEKYYQYAEYDFSVGREVSTSIANVDIYEEE